MFQTLDYLSKLTQSVFFCAAGENLGQTFDPSVLHLAEGSGLMLL